MKKTGVIALALLLSGCTHIMPSAQRTPAVFSIQPAVSELASLLPGNAGFRWQYSGFAEYAMRMTLRSVRPSANQTVYTVEGDVADMSGRGDSSGAFHVSVVYTASAGVLSQKLAGSKALDSVIPELELIRPPLAAGTKWTQTVQMQGKPITLSCSIDSVKTDEKGRVAYSVSYRQQGGDYYELRDITQGLGVTSFQRLYQYDGTSELIGYRLSELDALETMQAYRQWLPALNKPFIYFGLAEYGHKGALTQKPGNGQEDIYDYKGTYADGIGDESKFILEYRVDLARGTVTEHVISNERGTAEVNSKLHNLVVLKFPLSLGERWSHKARLNGREVTVRAEIVEYDDSKGIVKLRYAARGAAGYYNDTYVEERTIEKGFGMTAFSCLLPGNIGIRPVDAKDPAKLEDAIKQHSFGYTLNKSAG